MSEEVHQDFVDGYKDGHDLDCPEPNANRSERYKHSFAVGRAEALCQSAGSYDYLMRRAAEADRKERELHQ